MKAFEIQGRKAELMPTGQMLYRRALALVNEAKELELAAHKLSAGWEASITLAVEILFPSATLLACLDRFSRECPGTRIGLIESVLDDVLTQVRLLAVAHSDHPLHHQSHALTYRDLRHFQHIVARDSGHRRDNGP